MVQITIACNFFISFSLNQTMQLKRLVQYLPVSLRPGFRLEDCTDTMVFDAITVWKEGLYYFTCYLFKYLWIDTFKTSLIVYFKLGLPIIDNYGD